MKRQSFKIAALLAFEMAFGVSNAFADPVVPSRIIHVVYDDSGSMIVDPASNYKTYVDTWCQAKYSMEVLTAMLGENDKLNVYYMSSYDLVKNNDFSNCKNKIKPKASPALNIHGSLNAGIIQQNVNMVQETTTTDGDTPFCPVVDAYQDLKLNTDKPKEDKWLVIVTDGQFEDSNSQTTQKYYNDFSQDVNVVVLSIGKLVDTTIVPNEENGLLVRHAQTSQDVLNELTQIGNRIFQRNTIPVAADNTFTLNIPMKKIIVFAQGQNVDIPSLTNSNNQKSNRPVTSVRATQPSKNQATLRKRDLLKIDETIQNTNGALNGQLATFIGFSNNRFFAPDTYHVDTEGAESQNIQIYYDAFVGIGIKVFDEQGSELVPNKMEPGKYHVDLQFENPETHEKIKNEFLKNPKTGEDPSIKGILTIIRNNPDTGAEEIVSKSDFNMSTDFELAAGQRARIEYYGKYLEYNTLSSKDDGKDGAFMLPPRIPNPKVSFSQNAADGSGNDHASYSITGAGFKSDGQPLHFSLEAKDYSGRPVEISASDWGKLNFSVSPDKIAGIVTSFEIKKNIDKSIDIIPHFVESDFSSIKTQNAEITITPKITSDSLDVEGNFKTIIAFHNDIDVDELLWKPLALENYCIVCDGIAPKDAPIKVSVSLKNHELTDEMWNLLQPPSLNLLKKDMSVEGFDDCVKTDQKGVFVCQPLWSELALNTPFENEKSIVEFEIAGGSLNTDLLIAKSPADPKHEQLSIGSDISVSCWIMHYLGELIVALIALIIIVGEIIKPRLPKFKVKGKEHKMRYGSNHNHDEDINCKPQYSFAMIPYVAQTGSFATPDQEVYFKIKAVKCGKNSKMLITNLEDLKAQIKDDGISITVDGERIDQESDKVMLSVGEGAVKVCTKKLEYNIDLI